jgi:integrase/recombinase XerD
VNNEELECFILAQRYGALAIADASLLKMAEIVGDEIRYFRKKRRRSAKKQLVVVPLPAFVIAKLRALPVLQGKYLFCHGSEHLVSATDTWQSRLRQVFEVAGIENGESHRFRHTFAHDLLTRTPSVPLGLVSRFLGHASIKTTERHHSHFLEDRIQVAINVLRDLYASTECYAAVHTLDDGCRDREGSVSAFLSSLGTLVD